MRSTLTRCVVLLGLLLPSLASAEAVRDRFSAGGYFRIMTRPDFQGGDGKLGYWNLTGRLLNEGPWGTLALKLDLLQNALRGDPWASVVTQIEGGSFQNTDANLGQLGAFAVTRLYVEAGNMLAENLSFQLGTLERRFGDLGLYDMWPAEIFYDTVGLSARYDTKHVEVLLGVGDAGFQTRRADYSTILSAGGWVRLRAAGHFELGVGGQYRHEPKVEGNRNAPYATPGLNYEDFRRREVVKRWYEEHPKDTLFPNPVAGESSSYKAIGYLGFGGFGPLRWNNFYVNFMRLHPDNFYSEQYEGRDYVIFVREVTDERYQWNLGNEMQVALIPELLDATWGMILGYHYNKDNTVAPGEDNRTFYSTVLRLQAYLTPTIHLLAETALAREHSRNGNLYREHNDSVFRTDSKGVPDSRGLFVGDTDTRDTWQLKGGLILNPRGPGIFTRPSLRLLYGLQYSNQNQAYGNAFSDDLDQYNVFKGTESHWHSVVAIEAEAWF